MTPRSEANLVGVHPDLVRVVRFAAEYVPAKWPGLGFIVTEGVRKIERQRELFASGASQTMDSRHLTGHAVDLMATVGGPEGGRWEMNLYYRLAVAMREGAGAIGIPVEWGACWAGLLRIDASEDAMARAVAAYSAARKRIGKRPYIDGPHFQLPATLYPASVA